MKTRFTLTALALTSALAFSTSAMAAERTGMFNVHLKLTGTCEVLTTDTGLSGTKITTDSPNLAGADIDFGTHTASSSSLQIDKNNVGGASNGIQINCSKNTPFTVALEPQNVKTADGKGTMQGITSGNTDTIAYQLYKPTVSGSGLATTITETATSDPWGTGANVLSLTGKGLDSNATIKLPVFAAVPAGELDKFVDTYQDQVKVTLAY